MKKIILLTAIALISVSPYSNFLSAQSDKPDLKKTVVGQDSLFWIAYNKCDMEGMQKFFTDDVEFYHDRGGLTLGLENLMTGVKKNLCSNENFNLRREVVEGSIKIFPLQNSDAIYGAIISGEHVFYVLEKEKGERLDGLAKFTHVWILQDNVWKMSRVLSYDHGPAPYVNNRKGIKLTSGMLDQFVGQYLAPQAGICNVQRENDVLHLTIGDQNYFLYAQSHTIFFVKDRDLTFEFSKNEKGNVSRMIVRENGNIVEEAVAKK